MGLALGIDLGTTNSVAAVVRRGKVELARGPDGRVIHPSVVAFPEAGGVVVGQYARQLKALDPINTVFSIKRLIGQNMRAPLVQLALGALPYVVEEGQNQQAIVVVRGRRMTAPEVAALILAHMRRLTATQLGEDVEQAVITVPANFSDAQRHATREAGIIAGLDVLRLVNEPTAAALAYGYAQRRDELVAVFDFGGGTFDVSILKIRDDIFEVLGTGGDFFLGGDDLDRSLAEHLAAEMNRTLNVDPRRNPGAMARLALAAEQIKCRLSEADVAEGSIGGLMTDPSQSAQTMPFHVTRAELESLIVGYVDRTIEVCQQVLTATGVARGQIGDVILVGGSTRIPLVRQRVAEQFAREPVSRIDPDAVVAHGAAVQAAILTGGSAVVGHSALLLDVTPATLGVATAGGYVDRILDRNSPIPIERSKMFTTAHDHQTRVVVECCRGEGKRFENNELLGSLILEDLPRRARGEVQIEVTFRVDTDGILHVRARDVRTGTEQQARLDVIGAPVRSAGPAADAPASTPTSTS
jgi:molecular chaperone DnaK